jgi:proteasome lid subunit RPN8/RPN11
MDPEDQVRVCERIQASGMVCVGWYHSHPNFPAIPSIVDIENQVRVAQADILPHRSKWRRIDVLI